MNREAQSIVLLLVGGAVLRISLSDVYLRYVRAGLRPFLIVAGVLLVLIAVITLWREVFGRRVVTPARYDGKHRSAAAGGADTPGLAAAGDANALAGARPASATQQLTPGAGEHLGADDDGHGHGHGHGGPRVAWLLTLPVFAVFLIGPPPLGSYAASKQGAAAVAQPSSDFPPLPGGDPVTMTVLDYATRAIWEKGASLKGRRVSLTGFVTPGKGGRVYLTRIILTCCAADGRPLKVALAGDLPGRLRSDTWITVIGRYDPKEEEDPASGESIPYLKISQLDVIAAPKEPYET